MKTISAAIAAALLLCSVSHAQDHITFRGGYIGEPLSDFVNCDSHKAKPIKPYYKVHGKLCDGKLGAVWHSPVKGRWDTKLDGESFVFRDMKLIRITISVPNDDWAKVRYDLTQKLGEPSSETPQVYQNLLGAKWEFNQGFWRKGDIVAYAGMQVQTDSPCGGMTGLMAAALGGGYRPCADGIQVVVTRADLAGEPDTKPNSLD